MRLATGAGHAVRVIQTPDQPPLRRRRLVRSAERRAGARAASSSATRPAAHSPASRRPTTTRSAIWSSSPTPTCFLIAPASANTIAKLAARPRRQPAQQPPRSPRLPARGRAGDERPHVRAPRDAGEPRAAARARRARPRARPPAALRQRASGASAGCPSPPRCLPRVEAILAGVDARRQLGRHCACSSPPAARASRSTPCASSATAPPAGWASRSPRPPPRAAREVTRRRRERRAAEPAGVRCDRGADRAGDAARLRARVRPTATCC